MTNQEAYEYGVKLAGMLSALGKALKGGKGLVRGGASSATRAAAMGTGKNLARNATRASRLVGKKRGILSRLMPKSKAGKIGLGAGVGIGGGYAANEAITGGHPGGLLGKYIGG